jgi:hypothetical protein
LAVGAPKGFEAQIAPSRLARAGRGPFDVIVVFIKTAAALHAGFATQVPKLQVDGGLWIAWPKKASGVQTNVTENVVREAGLAAGLVDNKVCAIDEIWSGLRFVYRLRDRAGVASPERRTKTARSTRRRP